MLIVSVHPVSAVIAAGRPAAPGEVAPTPSTTVASSSPAAALSGLTRPLLDPATQLATQDVRRNNASTSRNSANPTDLTKEEQAQVQSLRNTDREVRQHERAHSNAGGPYAGVPTYQQVRGPDGRMYAVAGEVSIDASPASSPEATITKMDIVIRAALAPVNPSAQDHAIANKARQLRNEAVAEKRTEEREERSETSEAAGTAGVPALDPRPAIAEAATSTYRRIADLIAEPLGLVTPQTTVEIVV